MLHLIFAGVDIGCLRAMCSSVFFHCIACPLDNSLAAFVGHPKHRFVWLLCIMCNREAGLAGMPMARFLFGGNTVLLHIMLTFPRHPKPFAGRLLPLKFCRLYAAAAAKPQNYVEKIVQRFALNLRPGMPGL